MSGYVVLVDFRLKPGARAVFRNLIDDNARQSGRLEPGCRRFDVVEPHGDEDTVLLYEIYRDRAAFEAHLRSEQFCPLRRLERWPRRRQDHPPRRTRLRRV